MSFAPHFLRQIRGQKNFAEGTMGEIEQGKAIFLTKSAAAGLFTRGQPSKFHIFVPLTGLYPVVNKAGSISPANSKSLLWNRKRGK